MVRFRHFFLADILCSMVQSIKDIGYIACLFVEGDWVTQSVPTKNTCPLLGQYLLAIPIIPYWIRFAQCFRRWYDIRTNVHFVNAGKYSLVIVIDIINIKL